MDDLWPQPLPAATSQDDSCLEVNLLQILSDNDANILEDHEDIHLHHVTITKDELGEPGDAQEAGQDKNVDIPHMAAFFVDQKTTPGTTPLHLMAENEETKILENLIKAGVDAVHADKGTLSHLIALNDHEEIDENISKAGSAVVCEDLLLLADTHINNSDKSNSQLMFPSVTKKVYWEGNEVLPSLFSDDDDKEKLTPLHWSALFGHKEITEALLKAGANVDVQDENKMHLSALIGHTKMVEILLKAGALVDAEDKDKQTPLHWSALQGHTEIVKILFKSGAAVDAEDNDKHTPLHWSTLHGHKEIVEILLKSGAAHDTTDWAKRTPLHFSALIGHKEIVEILLKYGAAVDAEDKYKLTPLHFSALQGHTEIVEILLKSGATVDAKDKENQTPLHFSALHGHKEVFEILLKAGARVDAQGKYKETPLLFCLKEKHEDVAEVLISAGASIDKQDTYGECALNDKESNMRDNLSNISTPYRLTRSFYSETISFKSIWSYASKTTETELPVEENIQASVDSSSKTDPVPCFDPPTVGASSYFGDADYLSRITQQVYDHWAKFSPEPRDGWETSFSHDFKAAIQNRRYLMSPIINIYNIKKKIIYNCAPGSQLSIKKAEVVPMNSQVVIYQGNQGTAATDDNDEEEDSSSDENTDTNDGPNT